MSIPSLKGISTKEAKARGEWPCGHPRTPRNTHHVGSAGVRCATCRREINRRSIANLTGAQ